LRLTIQLLSFRNEQLSFMVTWCKELLIVLTCFIMIVTWHWLLSHIYLLKIRISVA
jgi:hypothetical protein